MYVPMHEGATMSPNLPDWLRLAIADAVVLFGRMEQEAIEIAWILTSADLKRKLKLARNPAKENFILALDTIESRAEGVKFDAIREGFTGLADERNLIVHGAWTMVDDKPWVVWHKFLQDDDGIIGEYFELRRFEYFMARGEHLLNALRRLHDMLEVQTGKKTSAVPRT